MSHDQLAALAEKARTGNGIARREVAETLAGLGEPAVELLITLLKDSSNAARGAAIASLTKIPDARAIEPLVAGLHDWDHYNCHAAADALVVIGEPAVEPLLGKLGDPSWKVRCAAASALGDIGDKRALGPLVRSLRDTDAMMRMSSAVALGQMGDAVAVPALLALMGDEFESVRRETCAALGRIGDPRAVPALITALMDERERVAQASVDSLRAIGEKTLPFLRNVANSPAAKLAAEIARDIGSAS